MSVGSVLLIHMGGSHRWLRSSWSERAQVICVFYFLTFKWLFKPIFKCPEYLASGGVALSCSMLEVGLFPRHLHRGTYCSPGCQGSAFPLCSVLCNP